MDSIYVPSSEASAVLSQLSSSRLNLPRYQGLNGAPDRYYRAAIAADLFGLADHPAVVRRLSLFEGYGVSGAMSTAASLDRVASVTENPGIVESVPERPDGPRPSGRAEGLEDFISYPEAGIYIQRGSDE